MKSLTVFMPAYREATTLADACRTVAKATQGANISDYEIIIVTDAYLDHTHDIAIEIEKSNRLVKVLHRPFKTGFGYKYRHALASASKEFFAYVPAHDLTEENSLVYIFNHLGRDESVITYTGNPEVRPFSARIVSRGYTLLCNILFGLRIKYYNGVSLQKTNILKKIPLSADNSVCMAEIIIYLAKSGYNYIEIPQILKKSKRKGRAFNFKSVLSCSATLIKIFWDIRFKKIRIVN
jgi:dolichol-phosphate mannosyltransferase